MENIRLGCLRLALEYARFRVEQGDYMISSKTEIMELAKQFYDFVNSK